MLNEILRGLLNRQDKGNAMDMTKTQDAATRGAFTPGSSVGGLAINQNGMNDGRLRINTINQAVPYTRENYPGHTNYGGPEDYMIDTPNGYIDPDKIMGDGTIRFNTTPTMADFQTGLANGGLSGSVPGLSRSPAPTNTGGLSQLLRKVIGR